MNDHKQTDKKKTSGRSKGSKYFRILIILLMFLIILLLLFQCKGESELEKSVKAQLGQLEGKSETEIQAELDRVVGEGMFHIVINPEPVFHDGKAEGNLEIENVPNNRYAMSVQLLLKDSKEEIYDSGLIYPNYHIQKDSLAKDLDAGTYETMAIFRAYDQETEKEIGSTSCEIIIRILN